MQLISDNLLYGNDIVHLHQARSIIDRFSLELDINFHYNFNSLQITIITTSSIYYFFLDLEWKLIYVGSAEDETYDQLLESVLVGPVNIGNYRFVFQVTNNKFN